MANKQTDDVFNTLCGSCGVKKSGDCGECKLARAKEILCAKGVG